MPPVAGTSTPEPSRRPGTVWLGLLLRTIGTGLVVVGALGCALVVVLLFDADPDVRLGAAVLLAAGLLLAGAGVLVRWAGRRRGPPPDLEVLRAVVVLVGIAVGWVVVPVAVVVGGIWFVVAVLRSDADLPGRMVGTGVGVFAVGLMVLVSVGYLRLWRGVPGPDGDGPPVATEWIVAGLIVGLGVVLLVAGVLELRSSGDVSLLVCGLVGILAVVGPACGTLSRWAAHRGRGRAGHRSAPR